MKSTDPLIDAEVPFRVEELLFSRTDARGVIQAGNGVFQRVSQYGWEEMRGAPHKILRHPDMPRAVFWLLWEEIQAGRAIGAYVKNRAKDGRYYWVFANVSRIEEGYLSVRLKPTSTLFPAIVAEYRAIRERELDDGLTPEESARILLDRLKSLGFPDYAAFMATALAQEAKARDAAMALPADTRIVRFEAMFDAIAAVKSEVGAIIDACNATQNISHNMEIRAARLGGSAGPVGVIANNYSRLSGNIWSGVEDLLASLDRVYTRISEALFLTGTARLQRDVANAFAAESGAAGGLAAEQEMARLTEQRGFGARARQEVAAVASDLQAFSAACAKTRWLVSGLNSMRVMSKVESARLPSHDDGLDEIIGRLDLFQATVEDCLNKIGRTTTAIRHETDAQESELALETA